VDKDQIYFRTRLGEQALAEPMRLLQYNLRRALALVDGRSTAAQVVTRFGDPVVGRAALADLLRAGLIGTDIPDAPSSAAAQARRNAEQGRPPQGMPGATPGVTGAPPWQAGASQARMRTASPIIEEISLSAEDDLEEPTSNLPMVIHPAEPAEMEPEKKSLMSRLREHRAKRGATPHLAVSWPLLALIVGLGLLAMGVALLVFFPFERYKPQVEQQFGAFLHSPVKIGAMRVTLTPKPNLTLEQVTIGGRGEEITIGSAKLIPSLGQLLQGNLVFSARLDGVDMDGRGLALLSAARGTVPPDAMRVVYAEFAGLALTLNDWRLDRLRGNIGVGDQGLEGANVRNEDDSLKLTLVAEGNKLRFSGMALDWRVGGQTVRSLDVEGEMDALSLRLTRLEGGALNGLVKGTLVAAWRPLLQVSGEVSLTRVDGSQLCSALGVNLPLRGEVSGSFRFGGGSENWPGLANPPQVEGDFRVLRGQLERFDFGMAVRNGGSSWVRGGATGFEELALGVRRDGQAWQIGSLNMIAGPLQATGNALIAADGGLSGALQVTLSDKIKSPVALSGTLREPLMRLQRSW